MGECGWRIGGRADYADGRYRINDEEATCRIASVADFYKKVLEETPIKIEKHEKFFRIGEQSALVIALALLVLRRADLTGMTGFGSTAIVGCGDEGSHTGNLTYWRDYVDNGRVAAQGHLFVGTLASTPLCQLALVLGCHAPVFYVSAAAGTGSVSAEMDFLADRCDSMFLVESGVDFCRCLFLRRDDAGLASHEAVRAMGDAG